MNRQFKAFLMLSLLMVLGVAAYAQSSRQMTANIPFDFIVGKTTLPAGEYTVGRIGDNPSVVMIQNTENYESVAVLTIGAQSREKSDAAKLIFNRYGKQHFLSSVWRGSDGRQLPKSTLEREVAKTAANRDTVLIAASLQ